MPTPRIPNGFEPVVQPYSAGAPDGVFLTEVGGGMPRTGLMWDRGLQAFQVTIIMRPEKYWIWTAFFHHHIKQGAYIFTMPLDSGAGKADHDVQMVPGSYSATRVGLHTSVAFVVLAEMDAYDLSAADADSLIDLWNEYGDGYDDLLDRLAIFANEDILVLNE